MNYVQLHFFADEIYRLEKEAGGLTAVAGGVTKLLGSGSKTTQAASRVAAPEALAQLTKTRQILKNTPSNTPEYSAALARHSQAYKAYTGVSRNLRIPAVRRPDGTLLPPPPSKPLPAALRNFAKKSGETTATVQRAGDTVSVASQRAMTNPTVMNVVQSANRTLQNPSTALMSGPAEFAVTMGGNVSSALLRNTGRTAGRRAGGVLDLVGEVAGAAM